MGPTKGFKRRRKTENKVDQNAMAVSIGSQSQPLDWWDDFSQRITGKYISATLSYAFSFTLLVHKFVMRSYCHYYYTHWFWNWSRELFYEGR